MKNRTPTCASLISCAEGCTFRQETIEIKPLMTYYCFAPVKRYPTEPKHSTVLTYSKNELKVQHH
jgi:hypothetical protein